MNDCLNVENGILTDYSDVGLEKSTRQTSLPETEPGGWRSSRCVAPLTRVALRRRNRKRNWKRNWTVKKYRTGAALSEIWRAKTDRNALNSRAEKGVNCCGVACTRVRHSGRGRSIAAPDRRRRRRRQRHDRRPKRPLTSRGGFPNRAAYFLTLRQFGAVGGSPDYAP